MASYLPTFSSCLKKLFQLISAFTFNEGRQHFIDGKLKCTNTLNSINIGYFCDAHGEWRHPYKSSC